MLKRNLGSNDKRTDRTSIPPTIFVVEQFSHDQPGGARTIVSPCPSIQFAERVVDESKAKNGVITRDPDGKEYIYKW